MMDIWDIGISISSVLGILGISVSVYRYDTDFLMQYLYHIYRYRYHTYIFVSYRYIGIMPIYWYWFGMGDLGDIGIEDIDMGEIGIGISVSYQFCNVVYVSYICIKIGMNPVSVSYRYIGIGSV